MFTITCAMNSSVAEILKPLVYFSRIFAMFPANLWRKSKKYNGFLDKINLAWTAFATCYLTGFSIYGVAERDFLIDGLVLNITDILQIFVSLLNCLVTMTVLFVAKNQITCVVDRLSKFDREIVDFYPSYLDPIEKSYRNCTKWICRLSIGMGIVIFAFIFVDAFLYMNEISFVMIGDIVAYCMPFAVMSVMALQFTTLVSLAKLRFDWINRLVVGVCKEQKESNQWPCSVFAFKPKIYSVETEKRNKLIRVLEFLRFKHMELVDVCQKINRIYSLPILLSTLQIFIVLIATVFSFFKSGHNLSAALSTTYVAFVAIFYCVEMLILVNICVKTADKARSTGDTLHKLKNSTCFDLDEYLIFFSLYLLQTPVRFSAVNIFPLDETLLFSAIGAMTTYFVIVLQFELAL